MDEEAKSIQLEALQAKRDSLQRKLDEMTPVNENARKIEIMDLLHQYNDIKDAAQIIIGALANLDGVTLKSLHEKFELPFD